MSQWLQKIKRESIKQLLLELKWIYHYSLQYKWAIAWYIFLGVFSTAMGLGSGVVSKSIIDAVTGFQHQKILPAAAAFLSMEIFQILSNACTTRVSAKIQIKVTQEIRADIFNKVMSADWEAMSEYHSGDLLNRVNGDVTTVAGSVIGWIPNLITSLVQFMATLAVILYYDKVLALLALLSAPVTMLMSKVILSRMRGHNRRMREVSSELMSFNEETFQNIQSIKCFGKIKLYNQKFDAVQDTYRTAQLHFNKFSILSSSFMSLTGMAVSSICFGWGIYRLWEGAITYGTMTLFLQLAGNLSASFHSLVNFVPNAVSAAVSARRIMDVTELPMEDDSDMEAAERFLKQHGDSGVRIRAENVKFSYQNGMEVLKDVCMEANPREVVALVGASGEGKTTILRLLLGLVRIKSGTAELYGQEGNGLIKISPSTRSLFSYVPQGNTMFSGTIADNIRLMDPEASDEAIWEALSEACADSFVKKLPKGLYTHLGERGVGLSEGQIQRISIARALISHAPVLLMDEATSALDMETERRVIKRIMESRRNKTCIVTTHRPSVLASCSRVYQIRECKLRQMGEEEIHAMLKEN